MAEQAMAKVTDYEATQAEAATSRRAFRGRVLAWLGLAMWAAGLLGAYGALGWPSPAGHGGEAAETGLMVASLSLLGAGSVGVLLAAIAVGQARRDRLAWAALAVDAVITLAGLSLLLAHR